MQRTQKFLFLLRIHRYRRCQNIAALCPSPTDIFCLTGSFIFIFVPRALSSNIRCRRLCTRNILFCEFCVLVTLSVDLMLFAERCKGGNCLESSSIIVSPMRTWLPLFAHFVSVCLRLSLVSALWSRVYVLKTWTSVWRPQVTEICDRMFALYRV